MVPGPTLFSEMRKLWLKEIKWIIKGDTALRTVLEGMFPNSHSVLFLLSHHGTFSSSSLAEYLSENFMNKSVYLITDIQWDPNVGLSEQRKP